MLPDSHYDEKKADCAVAFIQELRHIKTTEWAGKRFLLLPWQEQIVRDLFGIIKPNGEMGAEIYSVANDREQAGIVFHLAEQMALDNPVLRKYCKFVESRKRIIFTPTRSFYCAMSSEVKNKYCLNVHGCIFDELLGQTDCKLYNTMTLGASSARRQPLNFVITTAGNNRGSVCYEEHQYAMDILQGRKVDPSYYPVVFAARNDDDWHDPEVWRQVNPSFGITVPEDFYHSFHERAKSDVAIEMEFRQFYLCQWLSSSK